jgi:hypothetical protein
MVLRAGHGRIHPTSRAIEVLRTNQLHHHKAITTRIPVAIIHFRATGTNPNYIVRVSHARRVMENADQALAGRKI